MTERSTPTTRREKKMAETTPSPEALEGLPEDVQKGITENPVTFDFMRKEKKKA